MSSTPVVKDDLSLARYRMVLATSSGWPRRPMRRRAFEARPHPLGIARARDALQHHRRFRERGMDRIQPYLVAGAGAMKGRRFGQHPDRALAGAIGQRGRVADDAGDRGEIDDRAAAPLLHRPHSLAAAEKHALDIDRVDLAQVVKARGLDIAEVRDPRAVDEDVEPAERGEDRVDHLAPARFVRHVLHEDQIGVRLRAPRGPPRCDRSRRLSRPRRGTAPRSRGRCPKPRR